MTKSLDGRKYSLEGLRSLPLDLFLLEDILQLDGISRDVYHKASSEPSKTELLIQAELMRGISVKKGSLRNVIESSYGRELITFFDYAQKKSKGTRLSGDNTILHEHATQARAGRVFGPNLQGIAIAHDTVEDNSHSIVDIEFNLWEQRTRKYGFSEKDIEALRLLTNVYSTILNNAKERMSRRDKSYVKKLLLSVQIPADGNVKEQIKGFIQRHRKMLDRKQLYFDEHYLQDLEGIVEIINLEGLTNAEAINAIGNESKRYSAKKLKARVLKRELECQQEFLDLFVERPFLQRQFENVLDQLNAAKYSYIKAEQEQSRIEKQGVLLKIVEGLEEAVELIGNSVDFESIRLPAERLKRLEKSAEKANGSLEWGCMSAGC